MGCVVGLIANECRGHGLRVSHCFCECDGQFGACQPYIADGCEVDNERGRDDGQGEDDGGRSEMAVCVLEGKRVALECEGIQPLGLHFKFMKHYRKKSVSTV